MPALGGVGECTKSDYDNEKRHENEHKTIHYCNITRRADRLVCMNKPIVFADFHHASLLNSLIMLFEGRLGGQLYRPIGMEWAEKGFWKVYDHPATQQQFLGIGAATPDGTPKLNEVVGKDQIDPPRRGKYFCKDIEGDKTNKAITYEAFMQMPINIVIASIPQHVEPFKRLCEIHPNKPKLIFQIGNAWTIEAGLAPNIMASAIINDVPADINFISYHQEFDLKVFSPDPFSYPQKTPDQNIYSFVNVFQNFPDFTLFNQMKPMMGGWEMRSYGGQCPDGSMNGTQELANKMREARFIWHTKAGGDGYGHVIHNAAAVGRPMIVKKSYYIGKMAEKLLLDGVTCIDIDGLNLQEIKDKIDFYNEEGRYIRMCEDVKRNFKQVVDFDREFEQIKLFLDKLT